MPSLKELYQSIQTDYSYLPELKNGRIEIACIKTIDGFDQYQELNDAIEQFQPQQGWYCYQSSRSRFEQGQWTLKTVEQDGYLLNGELARDDQSLHIRSNGQSGWILTRYQYVPSQQETDLVQTQSYLAIPEDNQEIEPAQQRDSLKYQIYWQAHEHKMVKKLARFMGFGQVTVGGKNDSTR